MNKKTSVAIIGTVGVPARYGGFETLAEQLVDYLSGHGTGGDIDLTVYCTAKKYAKAERVARYKGARLVYLPFDANGLQSIFYDCLSMVHALLYADVLLVLGVSGGVLVPFIRWFTDKKIIISIDGIEWKRAKWTKMARWYLWAAEWLAVRYSHADIADNESIQDYTAIRYQTLSTLIEYGASQAQPVASTPADREQYPFLNAPYACGVCRIEPENNIHTVLAAFRQLPHYPLVMIGNWANSPYGRDLRQQYADCPNLHLLDPIYDQNRLDLIRSNCRVYIHGHSAGGTNPSLVDAMYLGLPVVAFDVAYNRTTTEDKARYFRSTDELVQRLSQLTPDDYAQQAVTMQAIAHRRYTWLLIVRKYQHLIERVMQQTQKAKLAPTTSRQLSSDTLLYYELGHLLNPSLFYER